VAGKIIADIIEAPYDSIRMNVANVTVLTANSSGLTYVPTGNVNINIGNTANITVGTLTANGIKFPATQVTSSDGNTLDDYEEGTFTPTISAGVSSITYSSQSGTYTKIGNVVYVRIRIALSAGTATSAHLTFAGLPFTCATPTPATLGECNSSFFNSTSTNAPLVQIEGGATIIRFYQTNASDFVGTNMNTAASAAIQIAGFYYV
jgi:hypothetical protein